MSVANPFTWTRLIGEACRRRPEFTVLAGAFLARDVDRQVRDGPPEVHERGAAV